MSFKESQGRKRASIQLQFSQFSSVAQSCLNFCECSMPGFPVHHQLPELSQIHVHCIGNAIQPSLPLLSPSPPAINLPSIRTFSSESVLHIRWPKYWSFSFRISPSDGYSGPISLGLTHWISLQSKGLSRVFSNTTVQKHHFFSIQLSLQSNSHIHRRRQWQPTPVLLPGKSHGQKSLVGCSPWGCEESNAMEQLHFHFSLSCIGKGNGNPLWCSCWRIPGMGKRGGLPSMGSHGVRHD